MTGCAHPSFELVGEEEEEEIKRAEAEAKFERWAFGAEREFVSSWTCTRCWESHLSAMRARAHVKER